MDPPSGPPRSVVRRAVPAGRPPARAAVGGPAGEDAEEGDAGERAGGGGNRVGERTMTARRNSGGIGRWIRQPLLGGVGLAAALVLSLAAAAGPSEFGRPFASPDSAVAALAEAARNQDRGEVKAILGPASDELQVSDQVQAENELAQFAGAFAAGHWLDRESDTRATLEVGTNHWPFPIPIVLTNGQWYFDTAAGKEEIANRRVGRNELSALESMRAYVDAQREYASRDRDGSQVLKYAQRILSTPGKEDGLYWPPELEGGMSPLGPLIAAAQGEGYSATNTDNLEPQPFHGYYFKILKRQGPHAPGGKYDYVINGNMIGGFAMVAWPADYGESGVMTFIVNQQGVVYQKDLGPSTASLARKITTYDPDPTWRRSPD